VGVSIPYTFYERLKLMIADHHGAIDGEEFDTEVTVYVYLPINQLDSFTAAVRNLTAGQISPLMLDEPRH
jgi:putative IMPACT (imprinted ancient) family translation regulator